MSIDPVQVADRVIKPTLHDLGMYSYSALQLVAGTMAVESDMGKFLVQLGGGPALGVYQMEPATYTDIWDNYLRYNPSYVSLIFSMLDVTHRPPASRMIWDIRFATIMCRLHYRRVKEPLPEAGNIKGMAWYWKEHYNTKLGRGEPNDFVSAFMQHCFRITP
jgi:hypothetical protein